MGPPARFRPRPRAWRGLGTRLGRPPAARSLPRARAGVARRGAPGAAAASRGSRTRPCCGAAATATPAAARSSARLPQPPHRRQSCPWPDLSYTFSQRPEPPARQGPTGLTGPGAQISAPLGRPGAATHHKHSRETTHDDRPCARRARGLNNSGLPPSRPRGAPPGAGASHTRRPRRKGLTGGLRGAPRLPRPLAAVDHGRRELDRASPL